MPRRKRQTLTTPYEYAVKCVCGPGPRVPDNGISQFRWRNRFRKRSRLYRSESLTSHSASAAVVVASRRQASLLARSEAAVQRCGVSLFKKQFLVGPSKLTRASRNEANEGGETCVHVLSAHPDLPMKLQPQYTKRLQSTRTFFSTQPSRGMRE
ncbi:hypothetical protein LX32DRAFT_173517 [Colletotrichum zoysiae]|uniref:Uncharacterized protein n=1 Tax=Colletotrichum zoysiae TaxID=1216348 RepID=A0AAD9H619_9PEZI|nr:hypothetical protein LX32DRAFT_173517 [Colletotrichum zoysiae]